MRWFWEILPLVLIGLFLLLALYFILAPGPWRISYPVRLLVGFVLLAYAGVRGVFWYKRWQREKMKGINR
ncbi:MAG TPA: hypothetical protein VFR89_03705 [candidate division Zixibacteria bacterium]|nr:hypothetical protein [candidate division Zixibacteria bacterium]